MAFWGVFKLSVNFALFQGIREIDEFQGGFRD
jgi:hypothetical protein